jgi:hypothetical protein
VRWQLLRDQLKVAVRWPELLVWSPLGAAQPVWSPPSEEGPEGSVRVVPANLEGPGACEPTRSSPLATPPAGSHVDSQSTTTPPPSSRCAPGRGFAVVVLGTGDPESAAGPAGGTLVFVDLARTVHSALTAAGFDSIMVYCNDVGTLCASASVLLGRQVRPLSLRNAQVGLLRLCCQYPLH